MKVNKNGEFSENPSHTIIHEIIHIGIEENIVKKFKLTHIEKFQDGKVTEKSSTST